MRRLFGYVSRPDEVKRILTEKDKPTFSEAAPGLANIWQQQEVGLWQAAKIVNNGQHLPADQQTIGDCVSHGYARGTDYLYCIKQSAGLVDGYVEGQTSAMSEAIYGSSRKGHLGWQDGSNGIWAVNGLKRDGYVFRNGKPYSGQLAKQYGYSGLPSSLVDTDRVLEDYALLETPTDMANALLAGSPCPICSNQGFTETRNADGICIASGTWNHCMLVIGLYKVAGNWFFVILQSWGAISPKGPIPSVGFPTNAFGCSWNTMGNILKQKDSYALNGIRGWKPVENMSWVM